jgi:hypothetical protein
MRRVVYTRDLIIFANVGQDVVLDVIPLAEIVSIQQVDPGRVQEYNISNASLVGISLVAILVIAVMTMYMWNLKLTMPWSFQPFLTHAKIQLAENRRRSQDVTKYIAINEMEIVYCLPATGNDDTKSVVREHI